MRATQRQLGLWSKLISKIPFSSKRPIGHDLAGNRYYELPNPVGGRTKRTVEYADSPTSYAYSSPEDYRRGTAQLPVQWTAWMSHTRATPPSMDELRKDAARQAALRVRVAMIEAREKAERIEQGYLLPDGTEAGEQNVPSSLDGDGLIGGVFATTGGSFASSGGTPHASAKFAYPPAPRDKMPKRRGSAPVVDLAQSESIEAPLQSQTSTPEASATDETSPIAPPRAKVDAMSTDANTLRQLAEEDTRRRLRESGVSEEGVGDAGVKGVGKAFRPRKRGA
ncbi:hypothetical protein CcaverHIS002_0605390 [Cutaneotrichosporon cavernicola]|uniref:NADH dehydrogenase [ubiquinone] 1 alpha subcomplex subunit n=1 Tax=Cutaneotrichosporon cavernicola TaxID=279322 RepID=A0AA48L8U4_9TREE|nr:uncharacterized protein CcaverHIS019_0604840 [Cutaneotrichosporon cavernicola]BEI86252.1 hypothetical protein CcaverHIS002_0605390 [Cutaneotrichosporon cavernicola]BEI94025.1 hypothetical protein CcaverHIS019_0604840 [Cutaneotrichosporon cavernicola]